MLYGGFQQLKIIKFRKVLRENVVTGVRISLLHLIYQLKCLPWGFITELKLTTWLPATFLSSDPASPPRLTVCFPPEISPSLAVCPRPGPPTSPRAPELLGLRLRSNSAPARRSPVLTPGRQNCGRRRRSSGPVWTFPPSGCP